ncbi:hypothetical protein BANRA_00003 [Klebsiella pneumoniae]|nr:hypothetical protein BANRA_00003 [Klebsiella pneumoniae]
MTVLVTQNGYGATRAYCSAGTLAGLTIAGLTLHFHVPESYTLSGMLLITLLSYRSFANTMAGRQALR